MLKWPKHASRSTRVLNFSRYRFAVLILLLFSFLPRVPFARASSPNLATDALSEEAAEFIIGPQAPISSSWFDQTEVDRGKFHGMNFPATPPTGDAVDAYTLTHYYDLGLTLAIAYKRTGDPEFLTLFRKVCDSWWKLPGWIDEGRVRQFDVQGTAPKSAGVGGMILRALDGRPEMWDWINAYTRYSLDLWLKSRINDPELYIGIREGAFALQYATWLAKVLPDSFPLQAGGTATNGAALRAQYLADLEAISVNYYGRLQYPDGSWRWDDWYYTDSEGGQLRGVMQPFMVGLLLDALIDVYQITTNETVRTNIQNQITKACRHLYSGGPYSTQRLSSLNVNLRGFHYFYHGGTTVNPTRYEQGDLPADWNPTNASDVQNQRQPIGLLVAAYGWSYQLTGDPFFKAAGDELWDSAYGQTDGIRNYMAGDAKSYNQNCRWAGSYLVWSGKPSPPTPTPTPTPTSSPTPTPTPTPTATPSPTPTATPSPTPTATPSPTPTATPTPSPTPTASSRALFVQLDTTTKGNWKASYGSQGYNTINDALNYPSYAQVNVSGYTSPTWTDSTTDVRALQKATGTGRLAARWSANSSFVIDLNLTDGQYHRIALYNLDWDGNNRTQRIDVFDMATGVLLDSKSISAFNGGQYLVWDIIGHVRISVVRTGAKTAVLSGLYFGTAVSTTPTPTPTPSPTPGGNVAPSVAIASPNGGSVFGTGSNISLSANASDSDGSVAKVDFFRNGLLIGTSTTAPYSLVWSSAPSGNYDITAKATDNRGATTTSNPVAIAIKNSPASVERARGRGNTLISELSTSPSYGGVDTTYAAATLSADLLSLANDVQTAYFDFVAEQNTFGSTASWINTQLAASLYLAKSDAALAAKLGASSSVRNHLLRLVAHLAVAEDLMLYGSASVGTQAQAAAANARLDLVIGPASASYTLNGTAQLAPLSLGSAFAAPDVAPLASRTLFASLGADGSAPYELAGINVTVGGHAVPVLYVSPSRISFHLPGDLPLGPVDVIVTSQDGFVSRGVTNITPNVIQFMTTTDDPNGTALALNDNNQTSGSFDVITPENFGSDKRTRVTIYATGISGSANNWDPSNDVVVGGVVRKNFAESVTVIARLNGGASITLPVKFAGTQGLLPGLDQVNIVLTSALAGAGPIELTIFVNGQRSNTPKIVVR